MPTISLVQDLNTLSQVHLEAVQYLRRVQSSHLSDSLPDAPVHVSSSPTDVASTVGLEVTPVTPATIDAAPLHYYNDVGED